MKTALRATLAAALLLAAGQARAQFPGDIPNNLRFRFGGIYANLDSTVTFSTSDFPSGEIDFTRLLDDPDHKFTFRGDGSWNFAGRSFLDFGYVRFGTDNSTTITEDIDFGGVIYPAGIEVSSETLSRFIYAAYRYGFVKNPSFQLGLSLGISYTTLEAQLSAAAGVKLPDGTVIGGSVTRQADLDAPVPLLGIDAEGRIAEGVSLGARFRAFSIFIDPYSGSMYEAMAHIDWFFARNVGVGGGYEWTKIDIEKERDDGSTIGFVYRYNGPRFYIVITF
jgi:hypothetical protein